MWLSVFKIYPFKLKFFFFSGFLYTFALSVGTIFGRQICTKSFYFFGVFETYIFL